MTKIARIEISDFRGFESVRSFDFKDADIVIFLGMNGFGKTSIFDAVEWCLTGHISRYESYLTSGRRQDFAEEKKVLRNKYSTDPHALVKIDLTDGKKFGRRVMVNRNGNGNDYGTGSIIDGFEFGINCIATQRIDPDVIHNYFSATHILSQETINHFVTSKKPEDRYRALSVNFGTSLYEPFDDNIQRLIAVLKVREDAHARKIEEANVRLQDFNGQLQAQSGQIEIQILEANKIISELKQIMPSIQLIDYSFDNSKSKINGVSTEEIQRILTMIRSGTEDASLKLSLLKSLAKDYANWIAQNKELSELDKQVIGNKQAIIKIKEAESVKASLENEANQTNIELQKELSNKNLAEFIHENISTFLESRTQIDLLTTEVTQRNNVAVENQQTLSTLMTTILSAEQKLREVTDWAQQAEALKNELNAFSKKSIRRSELEKITLDSQKNIETTQNLLKKLQKTEASIISSWLVLNKSHIDALQDVDAEIDIQPLLRQLESLTQAKETEERIKAAVQQKKNLETKSEALIKNLSKSQAMLANALELIPSDATENLCPVCEVSHDTQSLFAIIKSKIKATEASTLDKLKEEISKVENTIMSERKKHEDLMKSIEGQKAIVSQNLQGKIISLNSLITNANAASLTAKSEIQQSESEAFRLNAKASSLLNVELSNNLNDVIPLLDDKLVLQAAEKEVIKTSITNLANQKIELERAIELLSSTNRLSQERITALRSTDHEKINSFILDKGLPVDINLSGKIAAHLKDLQRLCEVLAHKLQKIASDKNTNILQLTELTKQRTEAQIESQTISLSNRITEISRFLSDYKEQAMRVEIDLGSISPQSIGAAEVKHDLTISQNSKRREFLTNLLEKTRLFSLFSKEDQLRKKIIKLHEDVQALKAEVDKIANAKKQIDELKKKFPKVLEKYITDNLDVKLFNQIYHSLNPHRRFKEIDFKVDVSYNKVGINFNATDSTLNARPEFLFSSAQLNTFGVSMFLSMALRQNWLNLDTILLDDPIQNLDDINVLSLIDLLRGLLDLKSKSKQVILSTHNERFYNLVKRKFADYKLKAFRFESYGRVMPD